MEKGKHGNGETQKRENTEKGKQGKGKTRKRENTEKGKHGKGKTGENLNSDFFIRTREMKIERKMSWLLGEKANNLYKTSMMKRSRNPPILSRPTWSVHQNT